MKEARCGWCGTLLGLALLAAGTLLLEIGLTRILAVAQFYHFAFMIISLAMLGYGASGTMLALFPGLGRRRPEAILAGLALGFGLAAIGAYLLINALPFDSFAIAWDRRQVGILALHYLALALPFLGSGATLGLLFVLYPGQAGRLYAANLAGSAAGCMLSPLVPLWAGGESTVLLSAALGGLAAFFFARLPQPRGRFVLRAAILALTLIGLAGLYPLPAVRLSPYKALSYALQYPGAQVTFRQWNGFSRIDRVTSAGIRSLPGLSYLYLQPLPPQQGLFVDGDDLSPVPALDPAGLDEPNPPLTFSAFLPSAIAYQLRPGGEALVLQPRGGLEIWVALAQGAGHVTAVEANPLIVQAADGIYGYARVTTVLEEPRSFVRRTADAYDIVALPLTAPYRPIRSGAYSLIEDYVYTTEGFRDYLNCLKPGGMLVVTRWLQQPPSEDLRTLSLAITALRQRGGAPRQQIVAWRGYSTITLLIKESPFTAEELAAIRRFAATRAFDLVYAPDLRAEEINRYNVLPEPTYEQTFASLLQAEDPSAWYTAYPLDVTPPGDDRPFFGHYFRWSQAGQVVAELGKSWQPFGGAGYFVLLLLLAVALAASALLIGLPLLVAGRRERRPRAQATPPAQVPAPGAAIAALKPRPPSRWATLAYFGLLGLGYMLVEIPLVQRFILFLGHPTYALTVVLFALLLSSGLGSILAHKIPLRPALLLLAALLLLYPAVLPPFFAAALGLPLALRIALAALILSPAGLLMGIPFPKGLARLQAQAPQHIPWAWGINGAASVIASVLAAILALSFGFSWVLLAGAACYALALGSLQWSVFSSQCSVGRS